MARRIVIHNTFSRTADAKAVKRISVGSLRTGDILLASGERVAKLTRDGERAKVTLKSGGAFYRVVDWNLDAKVAVSTRDGVGSPEEIAYGEGWHSTENANPYESALEKAAWEKGRAAKKLKFKMNQHSARQGPIGAGMKRKVSFEPPKVRQHDSWTMGTYCANCGWKAGSHQNGTMNCPVKGPGSGFRADQTFTPVKEEPFRSRDFKSEKGYVAKLIDAQSGKLLAKSEPHISNGEGLKRWIQTRAQELIRQGKRVKAEIAVVFFDPNLVNDNWYHSDKINGYFILEGSGSDTGKWLVRNKKYNIVRTLKSKAEAEAFAEQAPASV